MTDAETRPDGYATSDNAPDCMNGVEPMTAANDNVRPLPSSPNPSRWQPGHSGNPAGKTKGTRHHTTRIVEQLLSDYAETLARTVIKIALEGDIGALKMCMDRLAPPRRSHPITMTLPPVLTAADVDAAMSGMLAAMARGEIAPEQAVVVGQMLELKRRTIQTYARS